MITKKWWVIQEKKRGKWIPWTFYLGNAAGVAIEMYASKAGAHRAWQEYLDPHSPHDNELSEEKSRVIPVNVELPED